MLKLKPLIAAKAKANQLRTSENRVRANSPKQEITTRKELSKLAGIGSNTISRIEKIVDKAPDDVKTKLRAGEMSINEAHYTHHRYSLRGFKICGILWFLQVECSIVV